MRFDVELNVAVKTQKVCRIVSVIFFSAMIASACSKDSDSGKNPDSARGRAIYVANCVACHNSDPSKEGPIGPAIAGSPPELLESRVLRVEYPPGYTPKRNTKVMPTFPFLKEEIPYLAAYLSPRESGKGSG
jgi:mono/diheme cytochrome c family protein